MARNMMPKFKQARREGIDLHPDLDKAGTAKSPLLRKNYQPGMHGPRVGRAKLSNYGQQLREKQKAKRIYGILEKQFRNYYKRALKSGGATGDVILSLLESRLDNVVYRLGFAKTRPQARQMVSHGHILVNDKRSTIPSMRISAGNKISVIPRIAQKPQFQERTKSIDKGWEKIAMQPDIDEQKAIIDVRRIVEFYSR